MPAALVWERIRRAAAPEAAFLFVPAFTLMRVAVQQLGTGLVQAQPGLLLEMGIPPEHPEPPRLVAARPAAGAEAWDFAADPGFGTLSPVLLTEKDARAVAHFVYLAVESRGTPDLRSIEYELGLEGPELLFLPAVYDQRYVRDSNWRFLLREFDGLVA